MRYSVKSEQVNSDGEIIMGLGQNLSPKELVSLINDNFNTSNNDNRTCYGAYKGNQYCICFKNVSYLGHPHPLHKKRIQIPNYFVDVFAENKRKGILTFFLGVYTYKENIIFVDFDTAKYIYNKANNSSAHVLAIDIANATIKGIFIKNDSRENEITAFRPDYIQTYLEAKIVGGVDLRSEVVKTLDDFFDTLPLSWEGINCYQEMIDTSFNNKFQPEWPGFYLEYKLSVFIKQYDKEKVIKYVQNKKKGATDLDLYFPEMRAYGDLKAHSSTSSAIQGNDYDTIMKVVEENPIYYIVYNHDTIKDKDNAYKVTSFWNIAQKKDNLMSYANRMKAKVVIKNYMILEINKLNLRYLSDFKQGVNSNGKSRAPKIMIKKRDIENFIIHIHGVKP